MAITDKVACDVCGRERGETNHWLIAVHADFPDAEVPGIAFAPIDAAIDNPDGLRIEHLCGEECAHKRLSQWLEAIR